MLEALKERHPFKEQSEACVVKKWDTTEKDIQYLREIAVVEMLYDPNFVPNNPCQEHDPERVRMTPGIWWKLRRTASER